MINKNWLTLKCCVLILDTKKLKWKNWWEKGANAGEIWRRSDTTTLSANGNKQKCSLPRPLSCGYFRDLPIQFWCFGMSEVPAGSEHQHLSTAVRMETTTTIHPLCTKKKNSLERKVYFFAPPCSLPSLPPNSPSHYLFYNYSFFVLCYFCLHLWFPNGGWMYCCWRERKDAEGHT